MKTKQYFSRFAVLACIGALLLVPMVRASEPELSPEAFARILHTLDASRHRLPEATQWLHPESQAVLLGFTHVMNSTVPRLLEAQLPVLHLQGVTDLLIEAREGTETCDGFLEIARGLPPRPGFLEEWAIVYGPEYYSLLQSAERQGIEVHCADRRLRPEEAVPAFDDEFHLRNETISWRMIRMIEADRKPLLLIGAYHVNAVGELLVWLASRRTGTVLTLDAYYASELDGRHAPSEGLAYPDISQMLQNLGRDPFSRIRTVSRRPEEVFGPAGQHCSTCP